MILNPWMARFATLLLFTYMSAISIFGEIGAHYGAFHLLRLLQTHKSLANLDISEKPKIRRRLLNHWDNLDESIERGYAGRSLWKWSQLPGTLDPRYTAYARACASVGINGTVLNNVNNSGNKDILSIPDFGGLSNTRVSMEVQITSEYLG